MQPRLELREISKKYPAVVANDRISLSVFPGSIHAVLGENGAGKSTLMKIIYGVTQADSGSLLWEGEPQAISAPAQARRLGIGMVFQHFSLFPALTVLENILLLSPRGTDRRGLARRIEAVSAEYGIPVDPRATVGTLAVGERQRVEIVRCLLQEPKLLILDEPTSVLTPQAAEDLFVMLRRLAEAGHSILYISHKLHEIRELCDTATILRQGQVVATVDPRNATDDELAEHMLGTIAPALSRSTNAASGPVRLEVSGLSREAEPGRGVGLDGISLSLAGGEILGVAGIAGNGQAEFLEALSGEHPCVDDQIVRIDGHAIGRSGVVERRRRGLVYVPEERLGQGAVPGMSIAANGLLTTREQGFLQWGLVKRRAVEAFARRCISEFDVRPPDPSIIAETLSGGNLQKFIIGRELLQEPKVVVAAQPTWGLDVGAAQFIRQLLLQMRDAGNAILVVSEDLDELLEVADRISVMAQGRLSEGKPAAQCTAEELGRLMGGRDARAGQISGAGEHVVQD